jgi:hypothetical protein
MSVQLIVYPQSYDGQFNSISTTVNEFVVDGINFNTINTSSSYDTPSLLQTAIDNQPPSVVNTWYRYRTTGSGTPTLPTEVSGNLTLYSVSTQSLCGVYQKLSNLVVGNTYEIVIDVSTTGAGLIVPTIYDGSTFIAATIFSAGSSQVTYSFTATSVNQIIVISYSNTTADNIVISNISVSQQGVTPTTIFTDLQDGQVICDLYEDEDIPLSLSVDDFKNVAEKVQSYSKAFNLPATKRNNQIFDNIFEVTRTDTGLNFNPYKRTKCILKQDGFLLFEGYLRMIDISDKSGEISYNVNLYSEVVALADVLGDKTFSELDFTELQHDYQKTNIINSWNNAPSAGITYTNASTSGFRNANDTVKYPFVDWTHQILVGGSTGTAAIDGFPELTNLETAFRPFINIKYLIDRIFQVVPFTYESEFFDTDDFKKLYMDFNWAEAGTGVVDGFILASDADETVTYGSTQKTMECDTTTDGVNPDGTSIVASDFYDVTTDTFTSIADDTFILASATIKVLSMSSNFQSVNVSLFKNGSQIGSTSQTMATGNTYTISFWGNYVNIGDTLEVKIKSSSSNITLNSESFIKFNIQSYNINVNSSLLAIRGELGQWDFLKGLLTMFNLVTLPDEDNPSNIKIEPYGDIFMSSGDAANPNFFDDTSIELDWTDKIDVSEMKLMPLTDLNKKTIFKFVEDEDDYVFNQYKYSNNHLYGSKKYNASEFTILAGEDEIIAEPFAATVIKPLMSQFSDFITPSIYSLNEDGTSEGFKNSPRIMYNNGIQATGASYFIPEQNGLASQNLTDYLQFSHLTDVPTIAGTRDFHFGECQLIPPFAPVNDNLFNLYWLPYYSELYNPDTRIMTIKVNLSPSDISEFKFNDTVFIKNRTFRVNKIDYKPNDLATVEFILIP